MNLPSVSLEDEMAEQENELSFTVGEANLVLSLLERIVWYNNKGTYHPPTNLEASHMTRNILKFRTVVVCVKKNKGLYLYIS